jgi:hypothetical protein
VAEDRTRTERTSAERQERRRRRDDSFEANGTKNLFIPEEVEARLKAEGRTPRWVNDEKGRLLRLTTKDDYDKVDDVEPVRVGTAEGGEPIYAHLLSKPTEFIQEDQQKADVRRKSFEKAMVQGKVPTKAGQDPAPVAGQLGAETYVPDGNEIGRENRVIE